MPELYWAEYESQDGEVHVLFVVAESRDEAGEHARKFTPVNGKYLGMWEVIYPEDPQGSQYEVELRRRDVQE